MNRRQRLFDAIPFLAGFVIVLALFFIVASLASCTSNDVTRERHGDGSCTMVNKEKVLGITINTDRAIVGCSE